MGIASTFYNHSPIWIQNLACTLRGRNINRTRTMWSFANCWRSRKSPSDGQQGLVGAIVTRKQCREGVGASQAKEHRNG